MTIDTNLANLLAKAEGKEPVETTVESPTETVEEVVPAPSQEELKPETTEVKAEEPAPVKEAPFHKHPRWQRMQTELAEAREEARLAREEAKAVQQPKEEPHVQMPQSFSDLFGSNEEAWASWQKLGLVTKSDLQAEYKRMREEEQAETKKAVDANKKAVDWAEDQFMTLSDDTGIDFTSGTERNQVLDIIEKYSLFMPDGMPNIAKANELRAVLYPPPVVDVTEKKEIIAKTSNKTNSGAKESDVFTPAMLRAIERRGGAASLL